MDQTTISELTQKYESLDKQVDLPSAIKHIKGYKPSIAYTTLHKMYEKGFKAKIEKNHDVAYIFLKKWIGCARWIQKQKKFNEISSNFPNEKITRVENLLKEVSDSIKLECETKQERPLIQGNYRNTDLAFQLPETPNDEPQSKENDEITCAELAQILKQSNQSSEKRLLIIDVRKETDYLKSRINFPDNIVHIPAEKIHPNKNPDFYRQFLTDDKEEYDRYIRQSSKDIDITVLLDANSSLDTMSITSAINNFKKCLKECDSPTNCKRIAILKGGFEKWVKEFPELVSFNPIKNQVILTPTTPDSPIISLNTGYKFPDLNHHQPEETMSPILSSRHAAGLGVKDPSNLNSKVPSRSSKISSNPYKDLLNEKEKRLASSLMTNGNNKYRTIQPIQKNNQMTLSIQNGISDKQLLRSNNIKEAKVVVEQCRPRIDRSNKPTILGKKPTISVTSRLDKELSETQVSISKFHKQLEKGMQDIWAKEEVETLRKKEQEIIDKLARQRNTRSFDGNSGNLYPDLSDMTSDMTLGTRTRTTRTVKPNSNEEKANIPKLQEKDKIPPTLVDPQPSSIPQSMEIDIKESTYKEPLKSENISVEPGLKRSHSSPNLVQVKKLKANHQNLPKSTPIVNRMLKPSQVAENIDRSYENQCISWKSREQRFEPVFSSTKSTFDKKLSLN